MSQKNHCCKIGCEAGAVWWIDKAENRRPDTYLHSCGEHLGELADMFESDNLELFRLTDIYE